VAVGIGVAPLTVLPGREEFHGGEDPVQQLWASAVGSGDLSAGRWLPRKYARYAHGASPGDRLTAPRTTTRFRPASFAR